MIRRFVSLLAATLLAWPAAARAQEAGPRRLGPWLDEIGGALSRVEASAAGGKLDEARQAALTVYLDQYEPLESTYGTAGTYGTVETAARIAEAEARFHALLQAGTAAEARSLALQLRSQLGALRLAVGDAQALPRAGVPTDAATPTAALATGPARTPEIVAVLAELDAAESAYRAGDAATALGRIEHAYLERIEPLESRIPQGRVTRIERLIHLSLRPGMARGQAPAELAMDFAALRGELLGADAVLRAGTPFWFGAGNAFVILVREGLEAVLLIGALLAYLSAAGAGRRERRQIFYGAGAGLVATVATWLVARLVIPIGGGSRELLEGMTGLVAVGVLLYVSHWLFQKTYIHDWKEYLREHLGRAVGTGSALAMASLAFAAVYREGFETVLFYQAIIFDAGPRAVVAGFIPGLLLILGLGVAIIRLGVKLPLKRVFAVTNAILLYLAFVFLGKGLYNLQEAGVFAPHPLAWLPDHGALRQLLGFYPTIETLGAQALFLAALLTASLYYRRRLALRARAGPLAAAPRRPLATSR